MAVKINLGSGDQRLPDFIGLDHRRTAGTDLLCDLNSALPLASGSVSALYSKSVLEHIDRLLELLQEAERVLQPGGSFSIYVPHWSNPFYYSDYTHKRFFGLLTFEYFISSTEQRYRKVPVYTELSFQVSQVRLLFSSPFGPLNGLMKAVQWLVNRTKGTQLFYEFHLAHLIPCYAIEYTLRRKGQTA